MQTGTVNIFVLELTPSGYFLKSTIDNYESLNFSRSYFGAGTFSFTMMADSMQAQYVTVDSLIVVSDTYGDINYRVGIIQSVERILGEDSKQILNASGMEAKSILSWRTIDPGAQDRYSDSGDFETVTKDLVKSQCGSTADAVRQFPSFTVKASLGTGSTYAYSERWSNLFEAIQKASLRARHGTIIYWENGQLVFDTLLGVDRTLGNGVNNPAVFSSDFNTIKESTLTLSKQDYKNFNYTGGQGVGVDRTIREIYSTDSEPTGFSRREIFTDARDLSANGDLDVRGAEVLGERSYTSYIETLINPYATFSQSSGVDLGDYVTVEAFGVSQTSQITQINEQWSQIGYDIQFTMDKQLPTVQSVMTGQNYNASRLQAFTEVSPVIIADQVVVADTEDTTCFVGLFENATGSQECKTDEALTYDAATNTLSLGTAGCLHTNCLDAASSAGLTIRAFNDAAVCLLGAGGGQNATFYDGFTLSTMTQGSILFAGAAGLISQDNTNFNWNDSTDTLKIKNALSLTADVSGNATISTTGDMTLQGISFGEQKDPTGFFDPENVIVTGDPANKKITLTGTVKAFWRAKVVTALVSGWVSDAHGTDTSKVYYLYYNGTTIAWYDSVWTFDKLQIATAFYDTTAGTWVYQRECHGLQQWQCHEENHYTIGAWRQSGGDLSGYVPASTTAANRRPDISSMVHHDEDLETTQAALTSKSYTIGKLTSTGIIDFAVSQADIIPLSTNNPYYNLFSTPNWTQALMTANSVASVWVLSIPMAADTASQKLRFVFLQPQWETLATGAGAPALATALTNELKRSFTEVSLGNLRSLTPEILPIARIVVQYTGGNWTLVSVTQLTGSAFQLSVGPGGNFLSSVTTDTTLTGAGTVASPLSAIGGSGLTAGSIPFSDGTKFIQDNANLFWDDTNNRLGIGTAVPSTFLHIATPNTDSAFEFMALQTTFYPNRRKSIAFRDPTNIVGQISTMYDGTYTNMYFGHLYSGGYTTTDILTIKGNGQVGINRAPTTYPLEVQGGMAGIGAAATAGYIDVLADTTAYGELITFGSSKADTYFGQTNANYTILLSNGAASNGLIIGAYSDKPVIFGQNNTECFRIDTNNRIGIGTTAANSIVEIRDGLTTTGAVLTLGTKEPSVVANDILGRINFYAPLESDGGDSNLLAASIVAIAEAAFSTTVNATSIELQTGASGVATKKLVLTSDGRFYGTDLHIPMATDSRDVTGTTNQYIASGTYTPTLYNTTNIQASTAYACQWMRVGNVVTVSGRVDIDLDDGAGVTSTLGMSLPIASNFAGGNMNQLAGVAMMGDDKYGIAGWAIKADETNNRANFWSEAIKYSTSKHNHFTFTYVIV